MKMKTKVLLAALCALLLISSSVFGTIAWMHASTDSITNTFTVGNIQITLEESDDLDLKMLPGKEIEKDPLVTVLEDSEACWLFVKIDASENFDDFFGENGYAVPTGTGSWTELTSAASTDDLSKVYYREVSAEDVASADAAFYVLADKVADTTDIGENGSLQVLTSVTDDDLDEIRKDSTKAPTLTFTAYAVQKEGVDDAATAWEIAAEKASE